MKKLFKDLFGSAPRSLFAHIRALRPAKPKGTERLYVVTVDFPLDPLKRAEYDEVLEPLRKRYGLDFLLIEPGIQLKPFNEF